MANIPNYHFQVQMDGINDIRFDKVRNLAMGTEVIKERSGASPESSDIQTIGRDFFENFFLERAVTPGSNSFFELWRENQREQDSNVREPGRDIIISLLNRDHEPVMTWVARNAIPVRLSYSDLDSQSNELMKEILEFSCSGISVETR